MTDEPAVFEIARKLRYDLTAMQGKVSDLLKELAALNLQPPSLLTCRCGSTFRSVSILQEHAYSAHGGPLPDAWARADMLAEEPAETDAA